MPQVITSLYLFGFITDWKVFNFNQILSLFLMSWGAWRIAHIVRPLSDWIIGVGERIIDISADGTKILQAWLKKARKQWKNR